MRSQLKVSHPDLIHQNCRSRGTLLLDTFSGGVQDRLMQLCKNCYNWNSAFKLWKVEPFISPFLPILRLLKNPLFPSGLWTTGGVFLVDLAQFHTGTSLPHVLFLSILALHSRNLQSTVLWFFFKIPSVSPLANPSMTHDWSNSIRKSHNDVG